MIVTASPVLNTGTLNLFGKVKEVTIKFFTIIFIFFIVFSISLTNAAQYSLEYDKKVLDNGATIVSTYIEDSPLVMVQLRVRSGLSNEGEYASTGISHFLEHLIFKGTHKLNADQLKRKIKAIGGILNGSTGLDSAEYHITVPKENFETAVDLIIDMVTELNFSDEDFEAEKEVILKEIKMHRDDPMSRRMDLLFRQAFRTHVYKDPIIGYESLFKKLSKEDVRKYHKAAYVPGRIVVGAAGGIPTDSAIKTIESKIKKFKREKPWNPNISVEPVQTSERTVVFDGDVALGYMTIGYHSTSIYSGDLYAGDVLAMILGQGDDSRLNKVLVKEKQLLHSVSSFNYTPKYPGLFIITAIGDPDKLEEAREEIFSVIKNIEEGGVSDKEVQKAKNLAVSAHIQSQENIYNVTSSMTNSELLTGDPAFGDRYVEKISGVENLEVKIFAGEWLNNNKSTTVMLLPKIYSKIRSQDEEKKVPGKEIVKKLDNGLTVIAKERKRLPMVSVFFATNGGVITENEKNNGIANLTSSVAVKGTTTRSEEEIISVIENAGGEIGGFSGKDSVGVYVNTLKDDYVQAMEIFEDVLKNAGFPGKETDRDKRLTVAAIKRQDKNIVDKGRIILEEMLYSGHPYAMRPLGEVEIVEKLDRKQLVEYYNKCFVPEGSVITIVGDIDAEKIIEDISGKFLSWNRKHRSSAVDENRGKESESKKIKKIKKTEKEILMEKEQSMLFIGFQGVSLKDERTYALNIISSLLSGADGLLFNMLREEKGLVYASNARYVASKNKGYFVLYAATTKDNLVEVKERMLAAIKDISSGKFSDEELMSSRGKLITLHAKSLQSNYAMGQIMALDELYGVGYDDYRSFREKIYSITKEQIIKYAGEILDPDKSAILIIKGRS